MRNFDLNMVTTEDVLKLNGVYEIKKTSDVTFGLSQELVDIYIWIVYTVVGLLMDIFGIVSNIINILCFIKQGFKNSINVSLLGLAISDLGSLIHIMSLDIFLNPSFTTLDLPFDPTEILYLTSGTPHVTFCRVSSLITAVITLERCLCVILPLKIKTIVTPRRAFLVVILIFIISFITASPTFVVNKLGMKVSLHQNKTIVGLVSSEDRESVERVSFSINNFISFCAFIFIVACTILLAVKLQKSQKWKNQSSRSLEADKVVQRNRRTGKMVLMMSSLFITCYFPVCLASLALAFEPGLYFNDKFANIGIVCGGFAVFLETINASFNIFIYYRLSGKYRETLRAIVCRKYQK